MLLRIALFALAVAGGCRNAPPPTIERATFIQVMAELREARRTATDSLVFDSLKREILAGANVTDSALMEYVRVHGADPTVMAPVWDLIDARANAKPGESEPSSADTARSP